MITNQDILKDNNKQTYFEVFNNLIRMSFTIALN
jgi:hypothetical protein